MRTVLIIGIGVGDPDHLTLQAVKALQDVDVVFLIDKGSDKGALARLRTDICERHIKRPYRLVTADDPARDRAPACYEAAVAAWHSKRAAIYESMIRERLADGERGAFLVWGDPCLYDSTLRIVDQVAAMNTVAFDVEVIPGITSVQALAARHRIVLNGIGEPVAITTGRQLAQGMPAGIDNVVVMLDGECTFRRIADPDLAIYWGAYLGTADEILVAGKLQQRKDEIEAIRSAARQRHGWIMDTYLLRRQPS